MEERLLIVFQSTNFALEAEKRFRERGIQFEMMPTPREITSSCGLSIRFPLSDQGRVKEMVAQGEITIKGMYQIVNEPGGRKMLPL